MNLRKTAGLLMAFGLVIGLVGTGVGASFVDQVKATENIAVGTFGCEITDGDGTIAGDGSTIDYNAPTITSSAAGNAPFTFTVRNFGSIDQQLTVTASAASGSLNSSKFTAMTLAPASPVALAAGASQVFNTGIEWTELNSSDLGDSGFIRWTVDCGEVPATQTVISSALNYSSTGWGGWSCPAGTEIVSASVATASDGTGTPSYPIASLTLWEPGASVGGATYPNTPFGYTYTPPEEGAIVQNGGTGQTLYIVLECTLP
jgi:hypothetical protein